MRVLVVPRSMARSLGPTWGSASDRKEGLNGPSFRRGVFQGWDRPYVAETKQPTCPGAEPPLPDRSDDFWPRLGPQDTGLRRNNSAWRSGSGVGITCRWRILSSGGRADSSRTVSILLP